MDTLTAPAWQPAWDWPAACAALGVADRALAPALALPLPRRPARSLFAHLVRAICSQQVSVAAADAFEARLRAGCGGELSAGGLAGFSDEQLRAAGLSRQKATYVRALADAALQGRLQPAELAIEDDEAVIARLTALPGFGRWTAEMVLLFGLHRPDVWPAGDLGIRSAVTLLDGGGAATPVLSAAAVAARAEVWRPHRSTAALVLWTWRRSLRAAGDRAESAPAAPGPVAAGGQTG